MKFLLLLTVGLLGFVAGYSQHRIGDFLAYDHSNGLPASLYYSVCQSSDGYLWIGSSSGLVRFDGKRYKIFFSDFADTHSIADNVIVDLVEDDHQNLWIAGFYQGISKYNLRTGLIKRYKNATPGTGSAYGVNKILKDHQGQIWIATAGRGLGHYLSAQDSFEFFIPDPFSTSDGSNRETNHVTDITSDQGENHLLWLSCFDGLYSFDTRQGTFQRYAFNNPESKNERIAFLSIESDTGHQIWLGSWNNGLISFDKISHTFEIFPYLTGTPSNKNYYQVLDIERINDSTLYLASRNLGLLSFHTGTNEIRPLLTNDMLPGGSSGIDIQRVSVTPDAGIFVGGNYYLYQQHAAFNRFSQSRQEDYGKEFSLEESVLDTLRSGYWIAGIDAGGVLFLSEDMKRQIVYASADTRELHFVDVAIDKKNEIWVVGHSYGLLKLDERDNLFKPPKHDFPGADTLAGQILGVERDKEGNLWFVSNHSVYHYTVDKDKLQQFKLSKQENSYLGNIQLHAGTHQDAWISSNQGLFHCTIQENKIARIVPGPGGQQSLANEKVKSLTIDHAGNAWVGFESDGIQVVSGRDHRILARYTLKDGLPGMQINQMATDSAGRIWVGTSAGLALFNPDAEASGWQLFNREDGIKRDYIDRSIATTVDGKLFFNIEEGFSWIDIGNNQNSGTHLPVMHLVSLMVDGEPYLQDDRLPDFTNSIVLPYTSKEISIQYAAMDWLHPFRTKYFYRIEGISQPQEWTENNQALITLTGMKAGRYLLSLFAISGDGIKSEVIEIPIVMEAPFWQRWWFFALSTVGILLLGYAIYQYRIGQIKKLQSMRNSISTNLHDDIGASLSNIHILTELTQRNISNAVVATSYITKAGDEIQRISESLSDIVWNINPRYDDLHQLFVRMKRYAADMLEGKNIKADLFFPETAEKLSMPMDQRRDFYLIFKEAVNNLVKYSEATRATIMVSADHHTIRLEVSDDGKGFDHDILRYGNGIENMKQRAEKWNAHLQVISEPEKGTSILLVMKFG